MSKRSAEDSDSTRICHGKRQATTGDYQVSKHHSYQIDFRNRSVTGGELDRCSDPTHESEAAAGDSEADAWKEWEEEMSQVPHPFSFYAMLQCAALCHHPNE